MQEASHVASADDAGRVFVLSSARAFSNLLAAAESIERASPERLARVLASVAVDDLLEVARRHRCRGYLHRAILTHDIRTPSALAIVQATREERMRAALQAHATRKQLSDVMNVLECADVPFVLLKGAARLHRGDLEAEWNTMCDLDILIQPAQSEVASSALQRAGYRPKLPARRSTHHHLPPLFPPQPGLSVELHVALAPPGSLTTATDWDACKPYFERVIVGTVEAVCLNDIGTGFHLMVHGAGLHRLHDLIMLASILRSDAAHVDRLAAMIASERTNHVRLQAALDLSARIAGLPSRGGCQAERYIAWSVRREELPRFVRDRSQFADAFYGNGGSLWGPATPGAFPRFHEPAQPAILQPVIYLGRLLGRLATSVIAAAYAMERPQAG